MSTRLSPEQTRARMHTDAALRAEFVAKAWSVGKLSYLLRGYQKVVYWAIWAALSNPRTLKYALNISRRWGKTFLLCLIAVEMCLRKTGAQVRFAAPTGLELRKRIRPIMRTILRDCPDHLRPQWNGQDKVWIFPNDSEFHIAGVNGGHVDDLRGSGCDLAVIDEGGFIDEVDTLVGDVLMPQTLDTGGTLVGCSTPPKSPAHEYVDFYKACRDEGNLYFADIETMSTLPKWKRAAYAKECGGEGTIRWRREYGAEYITDVEIQVIPDWIAHRPEKLQPSPYVTAAPVCEYFPFWRRYVTMDLGATRRDFTAVLFSHYNFQQRCLYVERELIDSTLPRKESGELAAAISKIERDLWGPEDKRACGDLVRYSDNNNIDLLIQLMRDPEHPIAFSAVSKTELPTMVDNLRSWVKAGRVRVDPSCTNLIECLQDGTWKDDDWIGREFDRTTKLGHLDALAALIYQVLNVNEHDNPIPRDYGFNPTHQQWRRGESADPDREKLNDAFGTPQLGGRWDS